MKTIKKRILCVTLAVTMLFSLSISSFAAQNVTHEHDDCFITDEMIAESAEEVKQMIAEGEMLRKSRAQQEKLAVPHLYQDDPRWANVIIPGCGDQTYGEVGCALTCYAMMSRYFGNSLETPVTFGQKYYEKYKYPCNQNAANAAALMNKSATYAKKEELTDRLFENYLIRAIDKDQPVIIQTSKFDSHFILAYGYYITSEGNATIYIHDPESYDEGTTLKDYKNCEIWKAAAIG